MKRPGKNSARFITAGLILALLHCSGPQAPRELVIAHPQTLAAVPLSLMAEKPLAGYTIRLAPFTDHALAVAAFLRGESDLLYTGTSLGAAQATKGVRLWRTPVWGTASIVLRPGAAFSGKGALSALRGKRVALPFRGSPNDIQLRRLFEHHRIAAEIEYQPHLQAAASLLAGRIDAAVLPEPLASKLISEHRLLRLAELAALESQVFVDEAPSPMVSFFVTAQLPAEKLALLPELESRLSAALHVLHNDTPKIAKARAADFQVSPQVVVEGLRHTYFAMVPLKTAEARTRAFLRAAQLTRLPDNFFMP